MRDAGWGWIERALPPHCALPIRTAQHATVAVSGVLCLCPVGLAHSHECDAYSVHTHTQPPIHPAARAEHKRPANGRNRVPQEPHLLRAVLDESMDGHAVRAIAN